MGKNFRDTKQRAAILETLRNAAHPLTPNEIRDQASTEAPGLGIATVYRNIRLLMENGDIDSIEVPGHRTCYMIPQNNQRAVVVCKQTKQVRLADGLQIKIDPEALPEGFTPEEVEIFIYGHFADGA